MNRSARNGNTDIRSLDSLTLSSEALGKLVKAFIENGHRIQFSAKGNSMFPAIRNEDNVVVSPYHDTLPEIGDIIAYIDSKTKKLIIHRLIHLSKNGFVAKGDNCFHKDAYQSRENILGHISVNNRCRHILYGTNSIKTKKLIALTSRFGLTVIIAKLFKFQMFNKTDT